MNASKTILFVDDDKHLTRIVRDFLTHEQFVVHTAASAEEGLQRLQTISPDVIVLDISMPGMGGIGFLKRISNPDGSLQHPVLVLTARAAMRAFFETVAVDGFLPKPCSELDLIRKIRDITSGSDTPPDTGEAAPPVAHRPRIIIGEDDEDLQLIYKKIFGDGGIDAQVAVTGPDVLEKTVALHPDAVVMKELLPNMNGSIVARLIKAMPHSRHTPVIVHDATRTTEPNGGKTPAVDLFLLSAMPHDLVAAVRRLLSGRPARKSTPGTDGE